MLVSQFVPGCIQPIGLAVDRKRGDIKIKKQAGGGYIAIGADINVRIRARLGFRRCRPYYGSILNIEFDNAAAACERTEFKVGGTYQRLIKGGIGKACPIDEVFIVFIVGLLPLYFVVFIPSGQVEAYIGIGAQADICSGDKTAIGQGRNASVGSAPVEGNNDFRNKLPLRADFQNEQVGLRRIGNLAGQAGPQDDEVAIGPQADTRNLIGVRIRPVIQRLE